MTSPLIDDGAFDAGLNDIKNNAIRMCAAAMGALANTYANITANALGTITIAAGDFTGPADGPTDGRDLQQNQKDILADTAGTADVVAGHNNVDTVKYVSELASTVVLGIGDTLQVAAFDCARFRDPTSV